VPHCGLGAAIVAVDAVSLTTPPSGVPHCGWMTAGPDEPPDALTTPPSGVPHCGQEGRRVSV